MSQPDTQDSRFFISTNHGADSRANTQERGTASSVLNSPLHKKQKNMSSIPEPIIRSAITERVPTKEEPFFIRTVKPPDDRDLRIRISLEKLDTHEEVEIFALLDCGATGLFMDPKVV